MSDNFSSENRDVCETMWKNSVEPDRQQATIWRMDIACWIPTATKQTICNTHCFPTATMVALKAPQCYVIVQYIACHVDFFKRPA